MTPNEVDELIRDLRDVRAMVWRGARDRDVIGEIDALLGRLHQRWAEMVRKESAA